MSSFTGALSNLMSDFTNNENSLSTEIKVATCIVKGRNNGKIKLCFSTLSYLHANHTWPLS
jgi:hypothetical protein